MAGAHRCGSPRQHVQQTRAEPSAPKSAVFAVDAVRCFIFDERRKVKMGDEATIKLGFDQVLFIFEICSVAFHCPHDLPGQTQGAEHRLSGDMSDALLLPILNKCRNSLKELRFEWCDCEGITAASAASIGECSELEVLRPSDTVTSRLSEIVGGLPKLRELHCNFSDYPSSSLTDEGVIGLAMSCPDLELVNLGHCTNISDAVIASLLQCRALKELDLSNNNQLTDAAFAGLAEGCWPKMEFLDLNGLHLLSDAIFVSLARAYPSLVDLALDDTNVTDEAV